MRCWWSWQSAIHGSPELAVLPFQPCDVRLECRNLSSAGGGHSGETQGWVTYTSRLLRSEELPDTLGLEVEFQDLGIPQK